MFVRINGETHYLWRAVYHEGAVLEVFITKRRDRKAALKFLKCAIKRYGRPKVIVTSTVATFSNKTESQPWPNRVSFRPKCNIDILQTHVRLSLTMPYSSKKTRWGGVARGKTSLMAGIIKRDFFTISSGISDVLANAVLGSQSGNNIKIIFANDS
mgnify:CR=1 FL=1